MEISALATGLAFDYNWLQRKTIPNDDFVKGIRCIWELFSLPLSFFVSLCFSVARTNEGHLIFTFVKNEKKKPQTVYKKDDYKVSWKLN